MKVILIGNYPSDKQESMERFAQMLKKGFLEHRIDAEIWRPASLFGKPFNSTISGIGKWFGYIDKWLLFPLILMQRRKKLKSQSLKFHVCDHSNSPYLKYLPSDTVITCHDVLAIRGAFGYKDAYCPASKMGKILQKWILSHLIKAENIAAVSNTTLMQLLQLSGRKELKAGWTVVHNSFNDNFYQMDVETIAEIFKRSEIEIKKPFILHVGSSLPRKNRRLLPAMVSLLGDKWIGDIFFAGEDADPELLEDIQKFHLEERVKFIVKPSHEVLVALYNACEAFIFPSFSEGFGWPVIEAQACGAPVIASNIEPMPEVSGLAALHADPRNPETFAAAFFQLNDDDFYKQVVVNGLRNAENYKSEIMMEKYMVLHSLTNQMAHVS